MGINRIRLQAGSTEEMAKAEAAAAQNPELDKIRQQLFGEGYVQDIGKGEGIAQYYTGFGIPSSLQFTQPGEEVAPVADVTQPVVDTGGGDGGIGPVLPYIDVDSPKNTPFEQNLIDQGVGVQGALGDPVVAPGEMPVTQAEMDAFNQIPVNREYGDPMDIGYGEGQVDPNLAAAVGGKDTTPLGGANLVTTSSGDVFAADDPMLAEKMDYTEKTPAWWENARDKFIETGQDVGNFFTGLKDKGIDVGKMAGSAIISALAPGAGLLMQAIPKETPIDKFNREYALGGDLYQNVVAQSGDPNFEGRIQGYADDLIAGTGEGKDPFGINTVSAYGDYPEYATETFNELTEKAKQRATEGKELSQFDKDRLEYYGHVSGLTGKTNIPGTPLMVDDSPLKTFPEGTPEDATILPEDKPIIEEDIIKPVNTIAGNTVFVNTKTGEVFSDETLAYESLNPAVTGVDQAVTGVEGPPSILNPEIYQDPIMDIADDRRILQEELENYIDPILDMEPAESVDLGNPTGDSRIVPEEYETEGAPGLGYQDPIMDMAAEQAAAEAAAAQAAAAASAAAAQRAVDRNRGDGEGPRNIDTGNVTTAKGPPSQLSSSQNVYQDAIMRGQSGGGGNGGGGGGGKIGCTLMNDSYGFGSFRNKIWLRHSKDLAPEYQIGYHKIFLPLVRLSKTNKLLKKTLEHIAVHRTIDIRQEARGKKHLLGRVYRKILEPICYWVGKYAKR